MKKFLTRWLPIIGGFLAGLIACVSGVITTLSIRSVFPDIPNGVMLAITIVTIAVGIFYMLCAIMALRAEIRKILEYQRSVKPHELTYQSDEFFRFFSEWYNQPGDLNIICGNLDWITDGNNLSVYNKLLEKSKMKRLTILTSGEGIQSAIVNKLYSAGARVKTAPGNILSAYTFSCLSVMDDPAGKIIFRDKLKGVSNDGEGQKTKNSGKIIFEEVSNIHIMKLVTALLEGERDAMIPETNISPADSAPETGPDPEIAEQGLTCWDINVNIRRQDLEQGTDVTYVQVIKPWVIDKVLQISTEKSRILDTGCGCGYLTNAIYETGRKLLLGVDLSSLSIQCARKQYPYIPFICQNIYSYAPPEPIDNCIAVMTLNNLPDLDRYFTAVRDALTKGGKLIAVIPHPCFWPAGHLNGQEYSYFAERPYPYSFSTKGRKDYGAEITYYHRTMETYLRSIRENGFNVICWEELLDSSNKLTPDILGFVLEKAEST